MQIENSTSKSRKYFGYFILFILFIIFSVLPVLIINSNSLKITTKIATEKNISEKYNIKKSGQWKTSVLNKTTKNNQKSDPFTINTPCYSVKSKVNVEEKYKVNDCILSIELTKNDQLIGDIRVNYFIDSTATLEKEINEWKEFNKSYIIISEKDIQVGNLPAYQIVYKLYPSTEILHTIVFIYTDNRYEKIFGFPVNGFTLKSIYDEGSEIKSNFDYLISNWTWL